MVDAKTILQDKKPYPDLMHVHRHWDDGMDAVIAKIKPGEIYATQHEQELIATTLGSCIAVCAYDTSTPIGGMNHFMLPLNGDQGDHIGAKFDALSESARYGNWAMEFLINYLLKKGAKRRNLKVKIFGGGNVVSHLSQSAIGTHNARFIEQYVYDEGLVVTAKDLYGDYPRKILFDPLSGKVSMKRLKVGESSADLAEEETYMRSLDNKKSTDSNDVELF